MKIKQIIQTAILALAVVAVSGCYLALDNGSGEVGILLPDPRSVSESAPAELARIYVLNGPNLVPVGDGTDYAEFELAPAEGESLTEATVGPVPSGGGYQVVLVFGNEVTITADEEIPDVGGTGFVPVDYAVSGVFSVNAGEATVTDVSLAATPFVTIDGADTLGEEISGIVLATGDLYIATETSILVADGDLNIDTVIGLSPGEVATGISYGAVNAGDAAYVNTNFGVVPIRNGVPDLSFDANIPAGVGTILDSGGLRISGTAYGYLQYSGGITGFRQPTAAAPGVADWMEPADLSEIVVGAAVYDMAVAQYDNGGSKMGGFFATKLGAFLLPQSVLDDPTIDTTEKVLEEAVFFSSEVGGNKATITQIALSGDSTAPTSPVYLGTKRGAIRTTIADVVIDGAVITGTPIAGTANQEVIEILMGGTYVVILTDHFLTYSNDSGTTWDSVPVYAGASGPVKDVFLDFTSGKVLLAGETGLSAIDIF